MIRADIVTAKNKVSKRTVVTNKLLSLVLSMGHTYTTLRLLPNEVTGLLTHIVMAGDSTIVSTFFNPKLRLYNVLIRNAIYQVKSLARDFLGLCPQGKLYLTLVDRQLYSVDLNSKFCMDPIKVINSREWRHGWPVYTNLDYMLTLTFLEVDGEQMIFTPRQGVKVESVSSDKEREKVSGEKGGIVADDSVLQTVAIEAEKDKHRFLA